MAAAYAALVSLLNDLELIPNHPTHSFSFEAKQISTLSQTVEFLIDFMETYDSHCCTRGAAQVLESRIASAAHAAHDVIESHVVDQIRAGLTVGGKVRSYFLLDLEKAIHSMEFVKRKAMRFQAKSGLKKKKARYSAPFTSSSEPSLTTGNKNVLVGFDADLLQLMEMLTGEPSSYRQVIPIVGMGGMGKTTLARHVYDHALIHHHFDVRVWATLSQDYSVESILTQLLYGERNSITCGDVGELGEKLHKKLWGRRYLVVLDDMWSERAWDGIHMYLPDNGNGSCVIVMTRLSYLAPHLSSSSPFEMNFLDEDKSWELFCKKAFGEEEDCPLELEEIGKKIVKRCRGLPLSIVVIGGHLRRSFKAIEYWEKLSNSINPISSLGVEEQCLEIINLSYQHLPPCLKPCFLYMGIYAEDETINCIELHKLWIAEGFLKAKDGLCLEELAEEYLEDLIHRNLMILRHRRWDGKVLYCFIHDIVREFCLKVAKEEKFLCVLDTTQGVGCKERRIVVSDELLSSVEQHHPGGLELPLLLRSLNCQWNWLFDALSVDLRLLRLSANVALHKHFFWKKSTCFPTSVQQVNLRYIASYVPPAELPYFIRSSISLVWNMQTLIIRSGDEISMPYEIWEMPELRHLQFNRLRLPHPLPSDGSNQEEEGIILKNLHILFGVVDFKLTGEVCKRIPNIKKLSLLYHTFPGDGEEETSLYYCLHNLGRLRKLESLQCYFGRDSKWRDVFKSLTFPSSLVQLTIANCHWEDLTETIKSIPHLGYLELQYVSGSEWELAEEEEFHHLKILEISLSHELIHWNASSSNFPVLERLVISCWKQTSELSEIPLDFGEIPTLRLIELTGCSGGCALSAMRMLVEQEDVGNEDLQLRVRFEEMNGVERFQQMMREEGLSSNRLILYHKFDEIKHT